MTTYANVLTAPEIATRIVEAKFKARRLINLRNLHAKYQIASREDRAVSL